MEGKSGNKICGLNDRRLNDEVVGGGGKGGRSQIRARTPNLAKHSRRLGFATVIWKRKTVCRLRTPARMLLFTTSRPLITISKMLNVWLRHTMTPAPHLK